PLLPGVEVIKDASGYKIPGEEGFEKSAFGGWSWWREIRDEKTAFFARNISSGIHTFSYIARAEIPGQYHVMPAVGSLMYYPEVRGNSDEKKIEIK
ncbi:MAG: hypothetical protein Q8K98_12460, partial [Bacteroidota bacterium]|nr:hypothetical protein [Bacteroidota bacterium]